MSASRQALAETVAELTAGGKGILAADESTGTTEKRLGAVNGASTEETRRDYRELLFSTPALGAFLPAAHGSCSGARDQLPFRWSERDNGHRQPQCVKLHCREAAMDLELFIRAGITGWFAAPSLPLSSVPGRWLSALGIRHVL